MFTFEFLIFLLVIVTLYYLSPSRFRRLIILVASLVFLGYFSIASLIYALIFSFINYFLGIFIEKQKSTQAKRILYFSTLFIDIGGLVFFKYLNLFIESINFLSSLTQSAKSLPFTSLILPVGISYYTFQSIGYIYRVYKGMEKPEMNFINFSIYTLFFPKILAGPIEKSNHFLPQLFEKKEIAESNISAGLRLILFGFLKKLVIADNIGVLVTTVHGNLESYSGVSILITYLLHPIYIYFDFSGYTDIALGSARLFGYSLTENFNRPFFATNVTTLWRRWHISLTSWCNEFIFNIILFKRRRWKDWGAVYAVFLTFTIIGIWHGPRWNYLILGLLQGFAISFEYLTKKNRFNFYKRFKPGVSIIFGRIITYLFFSFSLIFFYLPTFKVAMEFISRIFIMEMNPSIWESVYEYRVKFILIPIIVIIFFTIEAFQERKKDIINSFNKLPNLLRYLLYYIVIYLIIWFGGTQQEFIYFQF